MEGCCRHFRQSLEHQTSSVWHPSSALYGVMPACANWSYSHPGIWCRQFRRPLERLMRMATFRKVLDRCKATKHCPHCGAQNGVVKCAPTPV